MNNKLFIFLVVAFVTALSNAESNQENVQTGVYSENDGLDSIGLGILGSASIQDNNGLVHRTGYLDGSPSFLGEYVPSEPKYNLAFDNYLQEYEKAPQSPGRLNRLKNYGYSSAKILGSKVSAVKSEIKRQASGYLGVPLEDAPTSTQSKSYQTFNALIEAMKNDTKNMNSNLQKLNLDANLKINVDNLFLSMQELVALATDTMDGPFFKKSSGLLRGFYSIVPNVLDNGGELIKGGVNMADLLPDTWSVLISLPRVVFLDLVKLANGSLVGDESVDYNRLASLALTAGLAGATGGTSAITPILGRAAISAANSAYKSYHRDQSNK